MSNRKALTSIESVDTRTGEITPRDASILPREMNGVVFVSGYRGIGKSFFAATADAPSRIAYLDFEEKAEGLNAQLHFAAYHSLTSEAAGKGATGLWDSTADAIRSIPEGCTVCVLDNIAPLELALRAEAGRDLQRYVKEFGLNLANVQAGRYGGLSSVVNFLITEKLTAPIHAKGVRLIIATSHVKPRWENGVPVLNKYSVKGADRWQELSILTLILHPGEHAPVPAALVQKEQLGTVRWDASTGTHTVGRRLPLRLPQCTFAEIRRYLREPADLRNPLAGEVPTEAQSDPFRSELNREQIAMMTAAMKVAEGEASEDAGAEISLNGHTAQALDEVTVRARAMKAEGKSLSEIALALGEKIPQTAARLRT